MPLLNGGACVALLAFVQAIWERRPPGFQNVEFAAAKVISREPVRYVRNIYKYYVAYLMLSEQAAVRRAAKEAAKTL
jgi:hypothetical protein